MRKTRRKLLFYVCLLIPLYGSGQSPLAVRFVNTGKMHVATNATASLYIPWSVKMAKESSIVQNGKTCIGGSFYQHASTNVFKVASDGWGTGFSSGVISFMMDNAGSKRHITVKDEDIRDFDRSTRYIAFPNILIDTNDTIFVPERMGMDAKTVKLPNESSKKGILYLQSNPDDAKAKVFDASLRITGNGTASGNVSSNNLVDLGSVVIERDLSIYRNLKDNEGHAGYGALFGFASPFTQQKSGYFAGNFVRTVSAGVNNADYASTFWHAEYPYANQTGTDGFIQPQYYLRSVNDLFNPSQAYLIRPQETGSNYTDFPYFVVTGGKNHDLAKFVFNGKIYNMDAYKEQVFAEDKLISRSLSQTNTTTLNWVIGNSYTSALDVQAVAKAMMDHPGIWFYEVIYVHPPGSSGYQPYYIGAGDDTPKLIELTDIPTQSIFMIRVAKGHAQSGTFSIDRRMLTHGKRSHNLKSAGTPENELLFRLSPLSNPNLFDLAAIGLRSNTSNTLEKVQTGATDAFLLYSPGKNNIAMSVNLFAPDVSEVPLSVRPSSSGGRFVLEVSRIESMSTEGVWLKDLKEGILSDLREKDTFSYEFDMEADDDPDRFVIYFRMPPTGLDDAPYSKLSSYYHDGELVIKGLEIQDENSVIGIVDMNGRTVMKTTVTAYPEMHIPVNLTEGVYVAKITGKRSLAMKFSKQ